MITKFTAALLLLCAMGVSHAGINEKVGSDITVAITVNNSFVAHDVFLFNYHTLALYYSPAFEQIYLKNTAKSSSVMYEYTYHGNRGDTVIPYTYFPKDQEAVLYPNSDAFISSTGRFDKDLDMNIVNSKMIIEDFTVMGASPNVLGCNMNNQHISKDVNRILIACTITYPSTS